MAELCQSKRKSCKNSHNHTHNHTLLLVLVVMTMAVIDIGKTVGRHYTALSHVTSSASFFTANAFQPMARNGGNSRTFRLKNLFPRRASSSSSNSNISNININNNDGSPSAVQSSYDMVVIGGGSAGLTAAKFASGTLKKSVLIVEQERLGGDCTWTGCVPSKSLLSKAKASKMARNYAIQQHSASSGNKSSNDNEISEAHRNQSRANFGKVQEYFRRVQEEIYEEDDSPRALEKFGIETIEGQKARLVSPTTLSFEKGSTTTTVEAKDGILLCTGAKPNRPTSIPGLSSIDYLTYEEIWTRDFGGSLPQKWTVVGGGPIGCELAQALSRLGASVTIITGSSGRLLPGIDDAEVSEMMKEVFEEDENITVLQGRLTKVESTSSEKSSSHVAFVEIITSKESISVEGEAMLLSIGRKPNTEGLGLETLGIDLDPKTGGIAVDTTLKTTVDGIYAAGDCTGDKQFTHYAGTYTTLHACMHTSIVFYFCSFFPFFEEIVFNFILLHQPQHTQPQCNAPCCLLASF
jgi:pyruvate/2-oxoglutarate dehydrogenase complex dihydrolipoamide dehydrogenase (E3) component